MAKPEPIPVVDGEAAKELEQRLKNPHIGSAEKQLYVGCHEDYRKRQTKK